MPEWAMTKFVSSSLIGMWLLTGSPSFWAAHCSQRCFSIFLPPLISVRWTVAVLLQLSHFIGLPQRRSTARQVRRARHRYRHVRTVGTAVPAARAVAQPVSPADAQSYFAPRAASIAIRR